MEQIGKLIETVEQRTREPEADTQIEPLKLDLGYRTLGDPKLELLAASTLQFCGEMLAGAHPRWLSILGTSGVGKTHLSTKALEWARRTLGRSDEFIYRRNGTATLHRDCMFIDCRVMARKAKNQDRPDYDRIREAFFVVIDDLGAAHDPSGYVSSIYDEIIDSRVGKWTFVTSNMTLQQIADTMDTRITSRLIRDGSIVVETDALDYGLR